MIQNMLGEYLELPNKDSYQVAQQIGNLLVEERVIPRRDLIIRPFERYLWAVQKREGTDPREYPVYAAIEWVVDRPMLTFCEYIDSKIKDRVHSALFEPDEVSFSKQI